MSKILEIIKEDEKLWDGMTDPQGIHTSTVAVLKALDVLADEIHALDKPVSNPEPTVKSVRAIIHKHLDRQNGDGAIDTDSMAKEILDLSKGE